MKKRRNTVFMFTVILLSVVIGVGGLRDVHVTMPAAAAPGDTVTLRCSYDLEGDPLYTVKWYKGRLEFFRYIPKELPHTRVFPLPGMNVDISQSGANQVVLRDVQMAQSGKYQCEVSADAPTFYTEMVDGMLYVVYLPEGDPKVMTEKLRYGVGETVRGNCSAPPSYPPANLTWIVNGKPMNSSSVRRSPWYGDSVREVTTITLDMDVDPSTFIGGKLRILCAGSVMQLYRAQAEMVLEEEKPRLAPVLGTRESAAQGSGVNGERAWLLIPLALLAAVFGR